MLLNLLADIRCALRNARRNPGIAAAVVALFAVGIGSTAAIFSVVDRVLFRALPYAAPARLVSLGIRIPWLEYDFLTLSTYLDLRRNPGPLDSLGAWSGIANCDWTGVRPVRLRCARADSYFLPVLGVAPELGRNFTAEEDRPDVPRVALISHALWKTGFGGEARAIGSRIVLDGEPARIIGVLPADFALPSLENADVLVPQAFPANLPASARLLRVCARLRPGTTVAQAREMLLAGSRNVLAEVPPHILSQVRFSVRTMRDFQTGDSRAVSWMLLAAVSAVLAVACANAAGLLLARAAARRRELAIRAALGAPHFRVVRQAMAETVSLALAGGILGCFLAQAFLRALVAMAPPDFPHLAHAAVDWRVVAFSLAASLACGAALGLAGAFRAPDPELLRASRVAGPRRWSARRILVAAQLALSLTLTAGAGMLLRSLWSRQALPLGFRTDGLVAAEVALGPRYRQPAARAAFYDQLEARVRRLPGVNAAAISDSLPPGGVPRSQPISAPFVEGRPSLQRGGIVVWRAVTPDYFRTLGIPILRGRAFNETDRDPAGNSAVLSSSYARFLFGAADPIGRRFARYPGTPTDTLWYTIVGVAADARNAGLEDHSDPEYYLVRHHGAGQREDAPDASALIVRSRTSAPALQARLRAEIAALDPALPVVVRTFDRHLGELAARPRFQAWVLAIFAGLGMLLTGFGVSALGSFLVARRQREFGIRLALGATPAQVVRAAISDALRYVAAGASLGLLGAAAAARALRGLLFHVSPADPAAYAGAALALACISLVSAWLPARRAASVDPAITLREE